MYSAHSGVLDNVSICALNIHVEMRAYLQLLPDAGGTGLWPPKAPFRIARATRKHPPLATNGEWTVREITERLVLCIICIATTM